MGTRSLDEPWNDEPTLVETGSGDERGLSHSGRPAGFLYASMLLATLLTSDRVTDAFGPWVCSKPGQKPNFAGCKLARTSSAPMVGVG